MEERLDDALNVLRNHCEPQLGITTSNIDGPPFGASPGGASNDPPPTIKLEKTTNSSKKIKQTSIYVADQFCFFFFQIRKTKRTTRRRFQAN